MGGGYILSTDEVIMAYRNGPDSDTTWTFKSKNGGALTPGATITIYALCASVQ